ncbi:hypothetical protein GTZ78_25320 [Streptomyces sp. SID8361]|nr:hypothetical protein [Streptomyces sp. SID8361]MYX63623.1 hypothetical protein [Streptomyces sp. SID8382]
MGPCSEPACSPRSATTEAASSAPEPHNTRTEDVEEAVALTRGPQSPTVSPLHRDGWSAVGPGAATRSTTTRSPMRRPSPPPARTR